MHSSSSSFFVSIFSCFIALVERKTHRANNQARLRWRRLINTLVLARLGGEREITRGQHANKDHISKAEWRVARGETAGGHHSEDWRVLFSAKREKELKPNALIYRFCRENSQRRRFLSFDLSPSPFFPSSPHTNSWQYSPPFPL